MLRAPRSLTTSAGLTLAALAALVAGCGESDNASTPGQARSAGDRSATSAPPTPTVTLTGTATPTPTPTAVPTSGAWIDCAAPEWTLPVCPVENRDFLVGTLDLPTLLPASAVGGEVTTFFEGVAAPDPRSQDVWNGVRIEAVAYTEGLPEDLGDPVSQECRREAFRTDVRVGDFSTVTCASPGDGSDSRSRIEIAWLRPEGFWVEVTLDQYGRGGYGAPIPADLLVDPAQLAEAVGEWAFDPTMPSTDLPVYDDQHPPESCGPVAGPGGTDEVLVTDVVGCPEALRVMDTYLNDPPYQPEGSGGFVDFDGWTCSSSLSSGTRCQQDQILIFYGDPLG